MWMHDSTAYFVPNLDAFVKNWMATGTRFLGYSYANPVCNTTMYVALLTTVAK